MQVIVRGDGARPSATVARDLQRFGAPGLPRFIRPRRFSCREMTELAVVNGTGYRGPKAMRRDC